MAGKIVHIELPSADSERAKTFWGTLMGWEFRPIEGPFEYHMFDGDPPGAIYPSESPGSGPIVYFGSVDIDSDIAQVRDLGGSAEEKQPIPGIRMVRALPRHGGQHLQPLPRRRVRARTRRVNAFATALAVIAGLAGAAQVAVMSKLGYCVGVFGALAFATALTALAAGVLLLVARQSLDGYAAAARQPVWMWSGALMGLLIVLTITFSGSRIGTAATVGILIAGQLAMGAVIDRFGLFGSERIPLAWPRVVGLALLARGGAAVAEEVSGRRELEAPGAALRMRYLSQTFQQTLGWIQPLISPVYCRTSTPRV